MGTKSRGFSGHERRSLILLVILCILCHPAWGKFATQCGQEILSQCQLVVEGVPLETIILPGGGSVIQFQVKGIFYGQSEFGKKISLIGQRQLSLLANQPYVLFLQNLVSANAFQVHGEFSLDDKDGSYKRQALEKLIAIEHMPVAASQTKVYLEYCLTGLSHQSNWFRAHAFHELEHLLAEHQELTSEELLTQLEQKYADFPVAELRERFQHLLVALRQKLPITAGRASTSNQGQSLLAQLRQSHSHITSSTCDITRKIEILQLVAIFPGTEAARTLLAALQDQSIQVRVLAAFYLGMQRCYESKAALLARLREDSSWRVRKQAITALGKLQAKEATAEIRKYLQFPYTSEAAQEALRQITAANEALPFSSK
jgi:hypothetical protein